jgi:hypothetical protein
VPRNREDVGRTPRLAAERIVPSYRLHQSPGDKLLCYETGFEPVDVQLGKHALAKAEKGYSDMQRYFSQATGMTAGVEKELQSKFRELRERLDGLKRLR